MTRAYIGLGSNQGEPVENIKKALKLIDGAKGIKITAVSSLYLTEPEGYEDQPWFYNCVAEIETGLSPQELLETLQHIENGLGRVRTVRWGPRTIDLDILLYDLCLVNTEQLTIPHPRMEERAFVMVPLAEIAGGALFPDGRTVNQVTNLLTNQRKCISIRQKMW